MKLIILGFLLIGCGEMQFDQRSVEHDENKLGSLDLPPESAYVSQDTLEVGQQKKVGKCSIKKSAEGVLVYCLDGTSIFVKGK